VRVNESIGISNGKPLLPLPQSERAESIAGTVLRENLLAHVEQIASVQSESQPSRPLTSTNSPPIQNLLAVSPNQFLLHTTVLPVLNVTLDQALVVQPELCNDPMECTRSDEKHVNSIIQGLLTFPHNSELRHARFTGNNMIYQVCCDHKFVI
jgi:hypothetical protein